MITGQFLITIVIFLAVYISIISEKVHRTVSAMAGAITLIVLGILNQVEAIDSIDFNTIGLLIGMMVIMGIAKKSGMFQYLAIYASKIGKGKPINIFIVLGLTAAILSAFLDNVTTVILMVPVTFVIANNLEISPKPFIMMEILLSNIGGMMTLIGDPPNILVGSATGMSFNDFLVNLAPVTSVIIIVTIFILYIWHRKKLIATPEAQDRIMQFNPSKTITDRGLLIKSLAVIFLVIMAFFIHDIVGLDAATIALAGAALILIITMNDPTEHLSNIEWTTIFFFIGLFILVAGLEKIGFINIIAQKIITLTDGNVSMTAISILWLSALSSAVLDNIPFVTTMIPVIKNIGIISGMSLASLWWALILGANLGGNATLIGASANVIVSGLAEKEGCKIGFLEYFKSAVVLTFIALLISTIYIYLIYLL